MLGNGLSGVGASESLDADGCESLSVYPEVGTSDMLESARLSLSLEGDENFIVSLKFSELRI